jgi:putative ABC transport system permease protein
MLASGEAFDQFKAALTTDPTLKVSVQRETEYYAAQSRNLSKLLNLLAYFVGGIMALGACFGAVNTMYTAVSTRTREIATLRAIGFSGVPIVVSVLAESLLLALLGSALGSAVAWMFFDGNTVNTLSANFTQVVFHLTVTASLFLSGVFVACSVGMLGGLLPAVRAARLPVATALRAA